MISIKNIFFLVFSLSVLSNSFAQTIEETAKVFWDAVHVKHDKVIVENGEKLIEYIEDNNFEIDSTIAEIRIRVGVSFSALGDAKRALTLNQKTLALCKEKWGDDGSFSSICLNNIAMNYSNLGDNNKSLEYNLIPRAKA